MDKGKLERHSTFITTGVWSEQCLGKRTLDRGHMTAVAGESGGHLVTFAA